MDEELYKIRKGPDSCRAVPLYPGIELRYVEVKGDCLFLEHSAQGQIMQINYCKSGQAAWNMKDGSRVCLHPGDFSLHWLDASAESVTLPTGE